MAWMDLTPPPPIPRRSSARKESRWWWAVLCKRLFQKKTVIMVGVPGGLIIYLVCLEILLWPFPTSRQIAVERLNVWQHQFTFAALPYIYLLLNEIRKCRSVSCLVVSWRSKSFFHALPDRFFIFNHFYCVICDVYCTILIINWSKHAGFAFNCCCLVRNIHSNVNATIF